MQTKSKHAQRTLEVLLVVIVLALMCLLYRTAGYKMVVLNLLTRRSCWQRFSSAAIGEVLLSAS